jgi:hypothetical protein
MGLGFEVGFTGSEVSTFGSAVGSIFGGSVIEFESSDSAIGGTTASGVKLYLASKAGL